MQRKFFVLSTVFDFLHLSLYHYKLMMRLVCIAFISNKQYFIYSFIENKCIKMFMLHTWKFSSMAVKKLKKTRRISVTYYKSKKIPLAVTRSPFTPLSEKNRSLFKMSGKNHGFYGKITATPTPQHYVPSYQKMLSLTLWGRILD